jgi:hypothetical protein
MFISPLPNNGPTTAFVQREKAATENYFITLSITEIYTTYTTTIQLGNGGITLTGQTATPTPESTASSLEPVVYGSSESDSGGLIALIIVVVGCSVVFLLLLIRFPACWRGNRGRRGLQGEPGAPGRDGQDGVAGAAGVAGPRRVIIID